MALSANATDQFETNQSGTSRSVTAQQIVGLVVFSGVGSPVGVITPLVSVAFYVDTSNGDFWKWYSAAWH